MLGRRYLRHKATPIWRRPKSGGVPGRGLWIRPRAWARAVSTRRTPTTPSAPAASRLWTGLVEFAVCPLEITTDKSRVILLESPLPPRFVQDAQSSWLRMKPLRAPLLLPGSLLLDKGGWPVPCL